MTDDINPAEMVNADGGTLAQEKARQAQQLADENAAASAVVEKSAEDKAYAYPLAKSVFHENVLFNILMQGSITDQGPTTDVVRQLAFILQNMGNQALRNQNMVVFAQRDEEAKAFNSIQVPILSDQVTEVITPGLISAYGVLTISEVLTQVYEFLRIPAEADKVKNIRNRILTAAGFKKAN